MSAALIHDLDEAQRSMMLRLKAADGHRASGSAGFVHVTAPDRREALRALETRGLCVAWEEPGILVGRITAAGRAHP